jgi:hypothetical protein
VKLHFLVEGPSEESFLNSLLPRLIGAHRFSVYPHQGKGKLSQDSGGRRSPSRRADRVTTSRGLLDLLPAKLKAWERSLDRNTDRIVILIDADDDDCAELLERIRTACRRYAPSLEILIRIAIEEVEAWYLGDWTALKKAFPRSRKRDVDAFQPDSIVGTWERFQELAGEPVERKLIWAEKMGAVLSIDPGRNRSPSYKKFCIGVRRHAGDTS